MALLKSKEEKEFEKQMDAQEPYSEASDESISRDKELNYSSGMVAENMVEHKRMILIPESQAEFPGKIDKDVTLAHIGGALPSIEELRFQIGTIELFEGEFVEEREVEIVDEEGHKIMDAKTQKPLRRKILIFDEAFRSCLNFLKAEYKFAIVASRSIGDVGERAAGLDTMTTTRIQKEFSKKTDKSKSTVGFGGT